MTVRKMIEYFGDDVASILGVNEMTVRSWKRGVTIPNVRTSCLIDELSDGKFNFIPSVYNDSPLLPLMRYCGGSPNEVGKVLSVPTQNVMKWMERGHIPPTRAKEFDKLTDGKLSLNKGALINSYPPSKVRDVFVRFDWDLKEASEVLHTSVSTLKMALKRGYFSKHSAQHIPSCNTISEILGPMDVRRERTIRLMKSS